MMYHTLTKKDKMSATYGDLRPGTADTKSLFDQLEAKYRAGEVERWAEKQGEVSGLMLDFDCFQMKPEPQLNGGHIEQLVN